MESCGRAAGRQAGRASAVLWTHAQRVGCGWWQHAARLGLGNPAANCIVGPAAGQGGTLGFCCMTVQQAQHQLYQGPCHLLDGGGQGPSFCRSQRHTIHLHRQHRLHPGTQQQPVLLTMYHTTRRCTHSHAPASPVAALCCPGQLGWWGVAGAGAAMFLAPHIPWQSGCTSMHCSTCDGRNRPHSVCSPVDSARLVGLYEVPPAPL